MEKLIPTAPATYRQLLRASQDVYSATLPKVIYFSLFFSLFIFLPKLVFSVLGIDLFGKLAAAQWNWGLLWNFPLSLIEIWLLIAIFFRIHSTVHGRHESLREDLTVGFHKLLLALLAVLLQNIIMFAAVIITFALQVMLTHLQSYLQNDTLAMFLTFLLFLFQLFLLTYIWVLFIFLIPVIATEKNGILVSIERTFNLVWNHWWRTLTLQVIPWIWYVLSFLLINFVLGINVHLFIIGNAIHNVSATLIQLVVFALFIPWSASLIYVQLQDLELRKALEKRKPHAKRSRKKN